MEQLSIEAYLRELASKEPVPGGGGTSALGGALGVGLGSMVCCLTAGKKRYAVYEDDIRRLQERCESLREELAELMSRDAEAFRPLAAAYALPKETAEQKVYRETVMEEALLRASLVPLEILKKASEGLILLEELLEKGSVMAVSDTGTGAAFLRAAIEGAAFNVLINTKSMKDRERAAAVNRETFVLREEGTKRAERICRCVRERLGG